ncbi:LuxR C-terminal-related transcriptional regulator [Mycobacterium sp. NPDC048908]|uniref:helix-turn-helix transcriptional regulator n=1 Tax=Mycobacterium sp. NPDC048908 TaxID=3364292 RepID=UPI00371822D8
MQTIVAALTDPGLAGILVSGPAGVGKSRIVREGLASVASRGFEPRWAVGTMSARKLPLGAFAPWTGSGSNDRLALVRGVIDSVTAAPAGIKVVLGVDDVHLLDELSTFVLHQIVQREAAKVVLTVREGERVPTEIYEIWRGGQFDRLDLQPLSADDIGHLLVGALGGPVDPDAAMRLWKLTRGNALYLRNIVEQEIADGRLKQQSGYWQWIGEPCMPRGLVELIESRFSGLSQPVGEVIDTLAVGEPLGMSTLRRIADAGAIEEAHVRGLITVDELDSELEVRLAHPLYGEVRRSRSPETRLRRLRGQVAEELARTPGSDEMSMVVRRASLILDSDLTPDTELLLKAAGGAVWVGDLRLADRLAKAAIRAGGPPRAYFLRAHALSWFPAGDEADAVLAELAGLQLGDDDRGRLAYLRALNMLWALGDADRAKAIIDEAARGVCPRLWIDAFLTVYWFAVDQPHEALEAAKGLVLEDLPAVAGAETAWALAVVLADAGKTAKAVAVADTGYQVATRFFDSPQMRFNIADAHVSALLLAGRFAEGLAVAQRVREQGAEMPGAAQLVGTAIAGRAALFAGHLDQACTLLGTAAPALSASGNEMGWGYRYHVPYATALAIRGATDDAAAVLTALEKTRRPFRKLDYEQSLARAWLAASQGALTEAIATMLSAAHSAAAKGQFAAEVMCLQTAAQFGDASVAARLTELASVVEGPRAALAARFASALAGSRAAEMSTVSEEFEEAGDLVAAVDAAAHACIAFRQGELRGSALGCSARAEALARRCGGISTPALREVSEPLPLTGREREIVRLLGSGYSTKDVAERLCVSTRTVEGHIYRAMTKTSAATREELIKMVLPDRPEK